jgi:uncharacterized protein YjbK
MSGNYPLEIELKPAFPAETCAELEDHPAFGGPGVLPPKAGREISTYFDTPGLAFHKKRMSLRVRSKGKSHIQTLKLDPDTNHIGAQRRNGNGRYQPAAWIPSCRAIPKPQALPRNGSSYSS